MMGEFFQNRVGRKVNGNRNSGEKIVPYGRVAQGYVNEIITLISFMAQGKREYAMTKMKDRIEYEKGMENLSREGREQLERDVSFLDNFANQVEQILPEYFDAKEDSSLRETELRAEIFSLIEGTMRYLFPEASKEEVNQKMKSFQQNFDFMSRARGERE